jgi:hypothetical protein
MLYMLYVRGVAKSENKFDGERRPEDTGLKITRHFP